MNTMRKLLAVVGAVLLWGSVASAGDIYVDVGNPCPGSGTVGDPFCTIQDGIGAASAGDTVHVAAGTYNEADLQVDKQLTVQGAGSASTIIDASGASTDYGLLLTAGGTSATQRLIIQGVTIQNSPSHGIKAYKAGGLSLDHVTLDDVTLTGNGSRGMEIHNDVAVSDIEVTNCQIVSNGAQGLRTASNVTVDGMVLADSDFSGNSYGIYLQGTINNLTLTGSTFNNSVGGYGAYMTETGPLTNMVVDDCEFNNNVCGLMVWNEQDNADITITGNSSFQDNDAWGVLIWGNTLANVLIEDSSVLNNDGSGSGYHGIDFYTYLDSISNVAVHNTNIAGHTAGGGLKNRNVPPETAIVDATSNWWGDATGADHATNPHGTGKGGDVVTDNVDFIPWYATSTTTPSTEFVTVTHNPVIAVSDTI